MDAGSWIWVALISLLLATMFLPFVVGQNNAQKSNAPSNVPVLYADPLVYYSYLE